MQLQYNELKKKYHECILLFRLGDFYEAFEEDAKIMAKVLGITLTGRGKDGSRIPMAGIPYHALDQYLPKLVEAGHKVAIAEQLEEAQQGKIVERDVKKVVTAGTITDEKSLSSSSNNYLACISKLKNKNAYVWGCAFIDLTTGEFYTFEILSNENSLPKKILDELVRLKVNEILIPESLNIELDGIVVTEFDDSYLDVNSSKKQLLTQFSVSSLKGFGVEDFTAGLMSASQIIEYLKDTQKTDLDHIKKITEFKIDQFMRLDESTIRNLEIFYSREEDATLYKVLNGSRTSMGQRLLKNWLLMPLINKKAIEDRLESVEFLKNSDQLTNLTECLSYIYDIERIVGRLGLSSANGRDLRFLSDSLKNILKITEIKFDKPNSYFENLLKNITQFSSISHIINLIENSISEEPPVTITEGGIIKHGFDSSLDELREISKGGKERMVAIQQSEISSTGINSLKVKFNNVFGYYIEVSKSNSDRVPGHYIRKQTLVNAERYVTEELKQMEETILGAQEKIVKIEFDLFNKIRHEIAGFINEIQEIAKSVAIIDVLANFAQLAIDKNYSRPEITTDRIFKLEKSRHPVIENLIDEAFISNELNFSNSENLMILTGPNMSGKSTFIRQVAINALMAHIGSFVPSSTAKVPLLDRIFTRVGASDNLSRGESTFMVEMNETANILNNATENSLIILDEVGRGTSTYDGISIAWAITEFIHESLKSFTLFATHYHEMTQLENKFERIVNYNVEVKEEGDQVRFMRKIKKGGTDKSYGIYVGKLAGLPENVISRARDILKGLEQNISGKAKRAGNKPEVQLAFIPSGEPKKEPNENSELMKELNDIDIDNLTPLQALQKIKEIKDKINS